MKAIEYNRVAEVGEYAREDSDQAAPRAVVHVLMHNAETTLCGSHKFSNTIRMKPRRIVTCPKCQDELRSARQSGVLPYLANPRTMAQRKVDIKTAANKARRQQLIRDGEAMQKLRECCGFVENGSEQAVRIAQDDATREWSVTVGTERMISTMPTTYSKTRSYHGKTLNEAIDTAYRVEKQEH